MGTDNRSSKTSSFVYNFRKQFAPKILSGEKAQTIRQNRKDGRVPKAGDTLRFFTGMRIAYCKKLGASIVTDCFPVYLDLSDIHARVMVVNGDRLGFGEMERFAKLDGFPSAIAMLCWFKATYKDLSAFHGFCIQWRPLRPAGTRRRLREVA